MILIILFHPMNGQVVHRLPSVIKLYNFILVKGQWCCLVGKV